MLSVVITLAHAPIAAAETESAPGAGAPHAGPADAAAPMGVEAKSHYERGLTLYAERAFDAAVQEFQWGYAIEPRREFLFAEAQAQRLAGRCDRALPLYERFLASGPSPLQTEAARLAIERCVRAAPAGDRSAPATDAASRPAVSSRSDAAEGAPERGAADAGEGRDPDARDGALAARGGDSPVPAAAPLWRDPWLLASGAAVVVASVIGVAALASAQSREQASGDATTYADFDRLWSSVDRRRTVGVTALAVAAAATGAGVFRVLRLQAERDRTSATPRSARAGWNLGALAIEGWIAW